MNYLNILGRLYNVPLAVTESKLSVIASNITIPLLMGHEVVDGDFIKTESPQVGTTKVGIVQVFDTLVAKGGAGNSGHTSYESIQSQALSLIGQGVHKIGFHIHSSGGEASCLFPLTAFIRSIPAVYGVETFSYGEGFMCSAAYAIGSACQRVYASPSSIVGSIGALMHLVDMSAKDKEDGIVHHILRSKDEKALGNPHEEMNQTVLLKYKGLLDSLDVLFDNDVSQNRSDLTLVKIADMKGSEFMGEEGLELNLVDSIVTMLPEVLEIETATKKLVTSGTLQGSALTTTTGSLMTLQEAEVALAAKQQELSTLQASTAQKVETAVSEERSRCLSILEAGKTLNMTADNIEGRLKAGDSKEASLTFFTAVAEAVAAASPIETTTGVTPSIIETEGSDDNLTVSGLQSSVADIMKPLTETKDA